MPWCRSRVSRCSREGRAGPAQSCAQPAARPRSASSSPCPVTLRSHRRDTTTRACRAFEPDLISIER
eukprot:583281-Prymnesium_polylepis.1